ncbi:MAG: hypothetical protein A3G24_18275 [Betaproteobacteria bacterium RIFCSPLOWO2_12_FULL_62_13]|nr:MAG: hypothetical protein A3G24_18275 [Betaproteobacteria bacterium RIFCSPLOWO2_12_FULL_62_13]
MPASNRIVFGRAFTITPVWMWILQRASGLLLGPLVALHVLVPDMAASRALNALLLAVVLAHGYSGLRRMVTAAGKAAFYSTLAIIWCVAVAIAGALLVISGS